MHVYEFICVYVTKMLILPTTAGQIYTFTMCVTHTHACMQKNKLGRIQIVSIIGLKIAQHPTAFSRCTGFLHSYPIHRTSLSRQKKNKNGGPAKNMHHRQFAKLLAQCSPSLFTIVYICLCVSVRLLVYLLEFNPNAMTYGHSDGHHQMYCFHIQTMKGLHH